MIWRIPLDFKVIFAYFWSFSSTFRIFQYKANLAGGPVTESSKTKGLVTGSRVRVLSGGETLVNPMAWTASYYDDFGRVVQTISNNHFETTSKEVVHNQYNFSCEGGDS